MNPRLPFTRRDFLHASGFGIGGLALTFLLHQETQAATAAEILKRLPSADSP